MSAKTSTQPAQDEPALDVPDTRTHDETPTSLSLGTTEINHTSQEHLAPGQPPFATPITSNPSQSTEGPNVRSPSPPMLPIVALEPTLSPVNSAATSSPGSTTDDSTPPPPPSEMKPPSSSLPITASKPSLSITLLLISGVRHQFVINESYLESHSVTGGTGKDSLKDPFEMSVWQLKECIWKDWRDEWDQRPASALFVRLIHFGRMLDDKQHLKDCKLSHDSPNVVHMTIRPAETGDDEMTQRSTKGGFGSRQRDDQRSPRCRCVIL
ncbi:unnamed protein product [Tuber melanosporum]|uniref:(Perigord truffle) hypothetical protein n=1 Tax=Tuber melanosporum (strain Mel28) TaxID=656061 RepID=D5GL59_TUBMM|nr:uncharacterized protein GSTUM_00010019001 [Tuber melanosporum]CAZ85252.1 unnamed protein product [Tuber melanosporum]